jgi:hypothetical protein
MGEQVTRPSSLGAGQAPFLRSLDIALQSLFERSFTLYSSACPCGKNDIRKTECSSDRQSSEAGRQTDKGKHGMMELNREPGSAKIEIDMVDETQEYKRTDDS